MDSYFGWLDYSEAEKKKMMNVISSLKEKDTRDELGVGIIRDTISDILFPGTSTIQTAAKYFLFIPWIYIKLEKRGTDTADFAKKARNYEISLIDALANGSQNTEGIIGIDARERLKRLPSNVYWTGLYKWGIRKIECSQEQYHRSINKFYQQNKHREVLEEDKTESSTERKKFNWNPNVESLIPKEFLKNSNYKTDLKLTNKESKFLKEQILLYIPDSLLAFLVDRGNTYDKSDFPWLHSRYNEFPDKLRNIIKHAKNFSEIMQGTALLYNLLLSQKAKEIQVNINSTELEAEYLKLLSEWEKKINSNRAEYLEWDKDEFWKIINENYKGNYPRTKRFVDYWVDYILKQLPVSDIYKDDYLLNLIANREKQVKKKFSRLTNSRLLERWGGAAGTRQLDYRWKQAQNILNDILEGIDNGK